MDLYLIRHAQSENNAKPESERVPDPAITPLGQEQAEHLAEWIPSLNLTRVITSPFLRTLQTADRIYARSAVETEVRIDLHELGGCYAGVLQSSRRGQPGLNRSEIHALFPDFDIEASLDGNGWWQSRPFESREQARQRANTLLQRTQDEFATTDHRIAYVMHADIKMLLLEAIGVAVHSFDTPYNASITQLHVTPRSFELVDYNRVDHLPARKLSY